MDETVEAAGEKDPWPPNKRLEALLLEEGASEKRLAWLVVWCVSWAWERAKPPGWAWAGQGGRLDVRQSSSYNIHHHSSPIFE